MITNYNAGDVIGTLYKKLLPTIYKNNSSILGLTKGGCKFTTSDFPAENSRT